MKYIELKDINEYKSESINPAKMQETIFELYSVPVYETGHPEYLTGKEIASSKILVRKNDILLCKINPRINRVWIVRKESENINIASSEWIVIRNNKYNPEFLAWYFRSRKFRQLMVSEVTGIGGSLTRAQPKRVAKYPVPIMDRIVQDKIVYRLNRIQKIIDMKKKELTKLDSLIQARFVELFGDAVYNDKKWETDTVKNLCKEIYGGGTPSKAHPEYYKDGDIPWVSAKDMKTDVLKDSQIKINQLGVDNSTARLVPVNSVIMVIRSGILKHTLPIAVNKVPITVNQDLKVFIPGERILTRFLAVQFKMQEKDILSGVRAVTADNIEFNSLKQRRMIVPPIDLQQKYLMFLERIDKSKFVIHKFLYCTTHNTKSIIKPRPNTKESGKIRGGKPHADEF